MFNNIITIVRGWLNKMFIFNKGKTLKEITGKSISDEHYKLLEKWKAIYSGYYKDWHDLKYMTIDGSQQRRMNSLNIAKVVCEELSKLIYNEKVEMNIGNKAFKEVIDKILDDNRFDKVFQSKIEQMFALGGLILKGHVKIETIGEVIDRSLKISFVTPDCFIPLSNENGEITECVFLNITKKKDKTYCLFEFHEWIISPKEGKKYSIRNELYESDNNINNTEAKKIPLSVLYPGLQEQTFIEGLSQPLFVYIKPNIANNFELQSPLGISIFANSLDTMYALDIAFDSLIREFRLGKRRIIVPTSAVRVVTDPQTGLQHRYFDANDEVYQAFNFEDSERQKIQDNTVSLRVDEHVSAINVLLNLLGMQIGFSPGTFTFDGATLKTATEVISEKSKTFQTKQSNENLIEEGLTKFINMLGELGELYDLFNVPDEYEVEFNWDDSIIRDRTSDEEFYGKLLGLGTITKVFYLTKVLGLSEEQAKKMIEEVNEENMSRTPQIEELNESFKSEGDEIIDDEVSEE